MASTSSQDILVITSAGGRQAAHLIPHFASDPSYRLRLVVRSDSSHARLTAAHPNAEVVQADMCEPADCRRVLQGATSIIHIGPSMHHHETVLGYNVIDAAVHESSAPGSKFRHFVYSSALNTQLRKLMDHDGKRYVEEYLMESGLKWTILQPANFMDKWPVAEFLKSPGKIITHPCMWDPTMPNAEIALVDLAEASAKVLKEREKHFYAQYPLSSIMPTSTQEAADMIGQVIGKKINLVKVDAADARKVLLTFCGYPDPATTPRLARDGAEHLILYYDSHSLNGNPNVLQSLLGREPTNFLTWTKMRIDETRKESKA